MKPVYWGLSLNFNPSLMCRFHYQDTFRPVNQKKKTDMEENKFMDKYGFLVVILVIVVIFVILKMIGFPEILYKP